MAAGPGNESGDGILRLPRLTASTHNAATWSHARFVRHYGQTDLRPVEAAMLERHGAAFAGRVLELGCGTGRVTGHLTQRARHVDALDLSAGMLAEARRRHPSAGFHQQDMTDLSGFADGNFDAVVASCNVLDALDDADRRTVLREVHRVMTDNGILVFSSHNRAHIELLDGPWRVPTHRLLAFANGLTKLPRRLRNRRRLRPLEVHADDYDIVNDSAHDWMLLQYYIAPADQRRQLGEAGFELLECRTLDDDAVDEDNPAPEPIELHYAARRA